MTSRNEATLPATRAPRSRKSLSHLPSTDSVEKENMTADIGALAGMDKRGGVEKQPKKSRSKSIGPGGLDALKDGTGNRRKSIVAPPPRSILKPTIAPLREIPAHIATRKPSPKKAKQQSPSKPANPNPPTFAIGQNDTGLPYTSRASVTGGEGLPNPFSTESNLAVAETRVMLRTEEEQQATAREREYLERVEAEKNLNARRDARRKSLANRRVSFAPEATLHTWDVVEYLQDSTTSSASTNSTRRASSASNGTLGSPHSRSPGPPSSDPSEPPSTPPEQIEETVTASPAHQRDLHQKKRRRSSGIPPLNFNNPDDEAFSSSPSTGGSAASDDDGSQASVDGDDNMSDSNSDSDEEGTAMSMDLGDATDMSVASVRSTASSTGSSVRLEEALQLAARQAGTQGIDFDEHGGMEPAEEEHEIVTSFKPWSKRGVLEDLSASHDQENLNPFSPAFKQGTTRTVDGLDDEDGETMEMTMAVGRILPPQQSDDEMTMDMTLAIGGIMATQPNISTDSRRKSTKDMRRQSTRRKSFDENSSLGEETMDLTMAIGGIQQLPEADEAAGHSDEDDDMTMEFTSVIGGVLAPGNAGLMKNSKNQSTDRSISLHSKRQSTDSAAGDDDDDNDEAMNMTVAVGGIMSSMSNNASDENSADSMEFTTTAPGRILSRQSASIDRSIAKVIMEQEADNAEIARSLSPSITATTSLKQAHGSTVASETGSPNLAAFKGKGLRRSINSRTSTTPRSNNTRMSAETSVQKPTSPKKLGTPTRSRPTTPTKTTPSKVLPVSSPKHTLQSGSGRKIATPTVPSSRKSATPNKLFQKDLVSGAATPNVILTPQKRRSSGIGIDRAGLGSPRVAAILDRRISIGESAVAFTASEPRFTTNGVRFEDPRIMEEELDKQVQDDKDLEDGRKIMEREADLAETEKDATINLKEMIESLTPKKRPLKGRKSLHVGAAKGLLGKRPVELDEDDDCNDESQDGIKRLKNHQGSPVKNVKLKAPPSKAETTGRSSRAARHSLEATSGNIVTPTLAVTRKDPTATTPMGQTRFRDPDTQVAVQQAVPFMEKEPVENPKLNESDYDDERIHLQDFLNMTSIRFMELTTTKRRHTVAPNALQDDLKDSKEDGGLLNASFESCVVAGACTIPMLELYQHSCRELKKYISEGRKVVREIESDTFEENPPLFREYMSATPDFRALMDNQFKNVKTHARLLSKATWYEWRMKLLDGLKDGLYKHREGMEVDAEILNHQQHILESILPSLIHDYETLAGEESELQEAAAELANCDQDELNEARQTLVSIETEIDTKKRMIQNLQDQLQVKELAIVTATERRQECLEDIQEAEKIRELCRGWSADEGLAFKEKVDDLERKYGWAITGVSGNQLSMTFRREIELVFDASSFKPNPAGTAPLQPASSRIDLWYIAANRELNPLPQTPEKDFFLQNIREHCRGLSQATTTVKALLDAVSVPWIKALDVVNNIQSLNRDCPTQIIKTSDSSIAVRSVLLIVPLSTKVELQFHINVCSTSNGFDIAVDAKTTVCYGERFNEAKMTEFITSRTSNQGEERKSWGAAVVELEERLVARGRK